MESQNEEVEPILKKRVLKYAGRMNLGHFSQFTVPITEMSPEEYQKIKREGEFLLAVPS